MDSFTHHVQSCEGVERCRGRSVLVAEEPHNDGKRNALLVKVHGFGFSQHVAMDRLRDRGTAQAAGSGGFFQYC